MSGPLLVVDAHQHVWDPSVAEYPWLTTDLGSINRVFDQPDVQPELDRAGVRATVLVQAADNVEDTENMFRVAAANPAIAGVVVWLPLSDAGRCERLLRAWQGRPVVGVRHLVHTDPDPHWMLRTDVQDGLALLAERGLPFDVCAETPQLLAQVPAVASAHPTLRLVIDHLAKPPIAAGGWQPWADLLAAAAAVSTVSTKLSGLNTVAAPGSDAAVLQPYVDHALDVFGSGRVMFGGDWPFSLTAGHSYTEVHRTLIATLGGLSDDQRADVLGGTARRIYRLSLPAGGHSGAAASEQPS
jgi:L-fuconolactonase